MYQDLVEQGRRIDIEPQQGEYGYYQVAEMWNAMLEEPDTARWGACRVLRLLSLIDGLADKDETLAIYDAPEWAEILARSGPAEAAWQATCPRCGLRNIGFGVSGFLDEHYTVDYEARTVHWRSIDEAPDSFPDETVCQKCASPLPEPDEESVFVVVKGFSVVRD